MLKRFVEVYEGTITYRLCPNYRTALIEAPTVDFNLNFKDNLEILIFFVVLMTAVTCI